MNFYMNTGKYRHLKEECFGLVKTFYSEYDWSFVEEANDAHVVVAYRNDHFFVSIFKVEAEISIIEGDYRNSVKKQLYQLLAKETGKKLPWGILQGIRPTKLVYKLFRKSGFESIKDGYEQLVKKMTEDYLVSVPMAELAVDVALEEFDLIPSRPDDSIASIYISIPFCPTRCHYCSFPSNPIKGWDEQLDDYVDGLIHEMEVLIPMILSRYTLSTVYVGGGTPTSLSPDQLDRLLKALKSFVGEQPIRELTLEAGRPDTITEDKLRVLKEHGVERISVNPQTMNQTTLDCIGRAHQVDDIYRGVSLAEKVGLNRVNMDTIIGLPGEKESHVRHTFNELMKIRPSEVTVHTLAVKRSSIIHERLDDYPLPNSDETKNLLNISREILRSNGYKPYYLYRQKNMVGSFENVGYYLDKPCIYNMEIMEEVISIFGFGAGAITKIVDSDGKVTRVENVKNAGIYIDRIEDMIGRKLKYLDHE